MSFVFVLTYGIKDGKRAEHLALMKKFLEFKKALSAGCSISPLELSKTMGLDVADAHFWELGLKQYEHSFEKLEKIVA